MLVVLGATSAKQLRCLLRSDRLIVGSRSNNEHYQLREFKTKQNYLKKSYQTLGVAEDCEDETLRLAFVYLAKQFHPDSGSSDASAARFSEIENAYRTVQKERSIQREKDSKFRPEIEEHDIKHTAPQHRHYLQYDTGAGTPGARQRRHTAERAQKAAENVMEHRLQKLQAAERNTLIGMDKIRAKDVKTRYGIDRLVEDLIQESMSKGEFSDLPLSGKPLKDNLSSQNPYVDFVTHKMNQVLIDNGFTPEWIQLSKEIRGDTRNIEERLRNARNKLGCLPLNPEDLHSWMETVNELEEPVKKINRQIDKYNLVVPILQKQMLQINLETLAKQALDQPPLIPNDKKNSNGGQKSKDTIDSGQTNFLDALFHSFNSSRQK